MTHTENPSPVATETANTNANSTSLADGGGEDREREALQQLEDAYSLIAHMDSCIKRGGPSNYAQSLSPEHSTILVAAFLDDPLGRFGDD